jgi:hypothetical protein
MPTLGHSTIGLTADTYTSVLPETASAAAKPTPRFCSPARPCRRSRYGRASAKAAVTNSDRLLVAAVFKRWIAGWG